MTLKVFIENSDRMYDRMFEQWGYELVNEYKEADIIVFTGGTDVDPLLYSEVPHPYTDNPDKARDAFCVSLFKYAKAQGIFKTGICRGSQFLTAMTGGKLDQHIRGHPNGSHEIKCVMGEDGRGNDFYKHDPGYFEGTFVVTSSHHQAMLPHKDTQVIARAMDGTVEAACTGWDNFAVQGHPEWVGMDHPFQRWYMESLAHFLADE